MTNQISVHKLPRKFAVRGDFEGLLKHFKLVDGTEAYPECIYLSKEDLKRFEKGFILAMRKQNSLYSKRQIQAAWGIYNLRLGPNQGLELAIKPGYVIIAERGTT